MVVPEDETWFKSVNDALLCIKRDKSYNFLDMEKPKLSSTD